MCRLIRSDRLLLRSLAAEGRTVLVSSHQLGEVQATCDAVAIVDRGRVVTTGTVPEVLHRGRPATLLVRVEDLGRGAATLQGAGFDAELDGVLLRVSAPANASADITRALAADGQWVEELRVDDGSLEDLFLEITGGPVEAREEVVA